MAFQEYPKALYKQGEYMAVQDSKQEESARNEGWDDWATDHASMNGEEQPQEAPKRRGRPPKAQTEE
jgi:hypothetical protein